MKYKVGDKVRVREDLIVDQWYGEDVFASGMVSFKGKIVTISNIESGFYILKEDSSRWSWTDEMFSEKVSQDFIPKESILQSTIPEGESSSDIITVKTSKIKLLLL